MLRPQVAWSLAIALVFSGLLFGQTSSLTLASGTASAGGSVPLNLSLGTTAGNQPAALQWTLSYSASNVASIAVTAGPAATAAGKTVTCSSAAQSRSCVISGTNATVISSGVVAIVTVTLTSTSSASVPITITNTLGARADGTADGVSGAGGTITVQTGGTTAGTAAFITTDFASSGWWKGMYGADGSTIVGDTSSTPGYVTVTPSGNAAYVWSASTSDLRALQKASSSATRVAGAWYSAGSFTVDLNFNDAGAHRVAIYLLDWDAAGRSERVDVMDANNKTLDTRTAANFKNGEYLVWNMSGHVVLHFTNTGPLNAVLGGIFFGASPVSVTSTAAAFAGGDNTTAGTWKGVYGADGSNIMGDTAVYPAYVTATPSGNSNQVWAASTADPRALTKHSSTTDRVAGAWDAAGSFTIDLNFHDTGTHRVALYLLDWDGANTRTERVDILDANSNLLDTRTAGGFSGGLYLRWNLSSHVILRITHAAGLNAVLSGIFFDGGATNSSTAVFVKTDTTTSGTWKGVYGADGFSLEADATNYPAYVTVTRPPTLTYTWTPSTSDTRALQESSSPSRVAACWFSGTSFSVDLSFHDSTVHQVALYLLDWDHNNQRAERVDILDANNNVLASQTAGAFSSGQYLVWNVTGHVVLRITNTGSPALNAVLSGIFFR